jgi:hypothetical protein
MEPKPELNMFQECLDLWIRFNVVITIYHTLLDLFMRFEVFTEVKISIVVSGLCRRVVL